MTDDERPQDESANNVLVFRNITGSPVAVPEEVVYDAERLYRVHKAWLGGKSWQDIADEEQYPSAGSARADYDRYMAEARSLVMEVSMQDAVTLAVAQLKALQSALWPAAMAGFPPAAREARNNIMDQLKVQGWNPEKLAEKEADVRTVVITGERAMDFIEELQQAAGDDTPFAGAGASEETPVRTTVVQQDPDTEE